MPLSWNEIKSRAIVFTNEWKNEVSEDAAQAVSYARLQFPNASLADLYDLNTMPPVLVKAHQASGPLSPDSVRCLSVTNSYIQTVPK